MADTLGEYLRDTRRLLHDAGKNYYPDADLSDYINQARRHVAIDTGALRTFYSVYLTAGQNTYNVGQACGALITAGGSGYVSAPTFTFGVNGTGTTTLTNGVVTGATITNADTGLVNSSYSATLSSGSAAITVYAIPAAVVDFVNITLIWGQMRINLKQYAYTDLSSYFLPWLEYQSIPAAYAIYGPQAIVLGPKPNVQYQIQLDTSVIPADLTLGATGPLVQPATAAVKYWAAHLAYMYAQDMQKAEDMKQLYRENILWAVNLYARRLQGVYMANENI